MLHVRTMGTAMIETPGGRLGPEAERIFALALVLGLSPGRSWTRDELCELIWPDAPARNARQNLRQGLYRLRGLGVEMECGGGSVGTHSTGVSSDTPIHDEQIDQLVQDIIAGRQGPFSYLGSYEPPVMGSFREWLVETKARTHKRILKGLLSGASREKERGNWSGVEALTRVALHIDSLNEEANLTRAESIAMMGGKAEAIVLLNGYADELSALSHSAALPARVLRRRVSEHDVGEGSSGHGQQLIFGREDQIANLTTVLEAAKVCFGSAHVITGSAGIGKTRLLDEVVSIAALKGFTIARVTVNAGDTEHPVHLLFRLFPLLVACRGAIGCNPGSLQLLSSTIQGERTTIDQSANGDSARAMSVALAAALADLCVAVADDAPLLIAVDNCERLDDTSRELLNVLQCRLQSHRCVILCCHRAGEAENSNHPALMSGFVRTSLLELSDSESMAHIDLLLKQFDLDPRARDAIYGCAGGNPLHIEMAVRHFTATGSTSPPASVRAAVGARINRCTAHEIRILQTIALAERHATTLLVEFASGLSPVDLIPAIESLENADLIAVRDERLAIKHDLIAEDVLGSMKPAIRMLLHRRIAEEVDRQFDEDETPLSAWARVRHWLAAGEVDRAASALRSCIFSTTSVGLPQEASELASTALRACRSDRARNAIYEPLVAALHEAGRWEDILRVDSSLRSGGSQTRTGSATELIRVFAEFRVCGRSAQTMDALESTIRDQSQPDAIRLSAAEFGLRIADTNGDRDMVESLFGHIQPMVHKTSSEDHTSLCILTIYHTCAGCLETARHSAEELIREASTCANPVLASRLLRYASVALERSGDARSALAPLEEALKIGRKLDSAFIQAVTSARILQISLAAGFHELACSTFGILQTISSPERDFITAEGALGTSARYYIANGEAQRARQLLSNPSRAFADMPLRHRAELSAVAAHASILLGYAKGASRLLRISSLASRTLADRGGFDYPAAVLTMAQSRGLISATDWIGWNSYLGVRREYESPGAGIRAIIARDGHIADGHACARVH